MACYRYKALAADGQEITGMLENAEESQVVSYLESQGYIPVEIRQQRVQSGGFSSLTVLHRRRYGKFSVIEFTNGLVMLLSSGLSVDQALKSLIKAAVDGDSRKLLTDIERAIRDGNSLSGALRPYQDLFGNLYISMVVAGEVSGELETALGQLSRYLSERKEMRERLINSMIYPSILLFVTVVSIVVLLVVVMPGFRQLFADMGGELPALTRFFIGVSEIMQQHGISIALFLIVVLSGFMVLKRHREFARMLDRWVLRLPWIGRLQRKSQLAGYAQTIAMMLRCGVPIQKTLDTGLQVVSNQWLKDNLTRATELMKDGASFSATVGRQFPVLTQQIVRVGEDAGELDGCLDKAARVSREEVDRDLQRAIGILEPLIIVFLGVIVAAVIGSVLIAVLSMNDLVAS